MIVYTSGGHVRGAIRAARGRGRKSDAKTSRGGKHESETTRAAVARGRIPAWVDPLPRVCYPVGVPRARPSQADPQGFNGREAEPRGAGSPPRQGTAREAARERVGLLASTHRPWAYGTRILG